MIGFQETRQADAPAIGRLHILLPRRQARACLPVAELHDGLAVIIRARRVDALVRAMSIERRGFLPEDGVDAHFGCGACAAWRVGACIGERRLAHSEALLNFACGATAES